MRFLYLTLENWRNFRSVGVPFRRRAFLAGPNASGKSNLLDAFRFLRDVADPEGTFQRAVSVRGGLSSIRCLHARQPSDVRIKVELDVAEDDRWTYELRFSQDNNQTPIVKEERVWHGAELIDSRPDDADLGDPKRLTETHLESTSANVRFRAVAEALASVRYLHLVPHLIREPERVRRVEQDPFGADFLEQLALMKTRRPKRLEQRLDRIKDALRVAVPQFASLDVERDTAGRPHLRARYEHWRPGAGWQSEDQFSDGTLRLIGLLWALSEGAGPLLLEEPELSLHPAVVRLLPAMFWRLTRKSGRQVILSTHSPDLLVDPGIAPEEVLLLRPTENGTQVTVSADDAEIAALVAGGASIADAVVPATAPARLEQLSLFADDPGDGD